MRYRKKPVVIEARRFTHDNGEEIAEWCGGTPIRDPLRRVDFIEIPTLEGRMTARAGDYIIKGVHGEFYPCKPDIFEATYEPV